MCISRDCLQNSICMNFGIPIVLKSNESHFTLHARLAKSIAPPSSPWSMSPVMLNDWLDQYRGKTFIGKMESDQFEMVLLDQTNSGRFKTGGSVIISGTIEGDTLHANLRPKLFQSLFMLFWIACASTGLLLSFLNPSITARIHCLIAAMLILPLALWVKMFVVEVQRTTLAIKRVFLDTGISQT